MFEPRDRVPHFVVCATDGATIDYQTIWQTAQLLLICLDDSQASDRFVRIGAELAAREADLASVEARLVVTRDTVSGIAAPGAVVADRYGEIYATVGPAAETSADDLLDWLRVVQCRCG